jgi:hypothetical protein
MDSGFSALRASPRNDSRYDSYFEIASLDGPSWQKTTILMRSESANRPASQGGFVDFFDRS